MKFTVADAGGTPVEFECADTLASRWVCGEILEGKTYPFLPFVDDVRVVLDAGANCGATSVFFARHYPDAAIHSFEPGSAPRAILRRNTDDYANIQVHPIGLHSIDQVVPLYKGGEDDILGSIFRRDINIDESEPVSLRAAGAWAAENAVDRIDVLKVDVEGCEVDVLESLADLLPTVKVLYVEYDSRQARRDVERLLENTHELYIGMLFLDQGECVYLRKDLAALESVTDHLRHLLAAGRTAPQSA
jgi:FkbM family methyltransferase